MESAVTSTEPEDHYTQSALCICPRRHEKGQVSGSVEYHYGHGMHPFYTFEVNNSFKVDDRLKILAGKMHRQFMQCGMKQRWYGHMWHEKPRFHGPTQW